MTDLFADGRLISSGWSWLGAGLGAMLAAGYGLASYRRYDVTHALCAAHHLRADGFDQA
ncbi:MAG: hypothetical protein ACYDC9_06560 [Dermatophilaceae bacterium]